MSEFEIIKRTKSPITGDILVKDLRDLGLMEKDIILVHSSLAAIGWVCGEERTVIEALRKVVGPEGTICMPAHSGSNSDPAKWQNPPVPKDWIETIYQSMPPFHPDLTPTRGIGRIPEVFRTYPGIKRSYHPQTSFCVLGKYAEIITDNHKLSPQFGMESPLGKLYQLNAKVLFLGTGYNTCTCFHLAEVLSQAASVMQLGASMMTEHGREWIWFNDYDYDCEDFEDLGKAFEEYYPVNVGVVGQGESRLFHIRPAVDFAVKWLMENRKIDK